MENSKWQPSNIDKVGKMERCLLGSQEIQVPEIFIEQTHIFNEIMSQDTWNKVLTESQRQHLMTFLPKFPEADNEEKRETLRKLFKGDNFKFGNPLQKFHYKLKDGAYSPDIAKYGAICHKVKEKEYQYKLQKYYAALVKDILLSRQRVFDQLSQLPPDEPIKFDYVPPKPRENPIEMRVKRKYKRLLQEVHQECGVEDTSSEEDEGSTVQRSKKQLFKSLNPVPSPDPVVPSVQATYSAKPVFTNGDSDDGSPVMKRPRPISPCEVTEDLYRKMLLKHKRRQLEDDYDEEEHPEYNTQNISLQDVMARCQASRRGGNEADDEDNLELISTQPLKTKVKKEKIEKRSRKKMSKKICDMDLDHEEDDERTQVSVDNMEDETSTLDHFSGIQSLQGGSQEVYGHLPCFFSLLRHCILRCQDHRISTAKLEERVREWQESPSSDECHWVSQQDDWTEQVASALKYLAGETIGMNMDDFIPYLDYKERAQQWHWIGAGRDSDDKLQPLCDHWLKHKAEFSDLVVDTNQGSPPPARSRTGFVVRATTEDEKAHFQVQERERFEKPHKAHTYEMHDYKSIVGPVKGVYSKRTDMTKAREHTLLVSNRPAFVTILTLVRDAVARLPNGEGTRGDICELLKDSQFLAPGISDNQINVVVSGALDRLHSEKDPCVKYDVNRKVWIYLHRSRTEEEFEKIHQAQAAAMKAKKSLSKPKTQKAVTKLRDMTSPAQASPSLTSLKTPTSMAPSLDTPEEAGPQPGGHTQLLASTTPQGTSPKALQSSPKAVTRQPSSGSSKSAGITQSLTPAQLHLLQQAAAAQAAHVKAQAEAQAAKAQAQAQASLAKAQIAKPAAASSPTRAEIASALQKNITLSQGQLKVIPQAQVVKTTAPPPNVTIQTKPEIQLHRQVSGQSSPSIQIVTTATPVTKTVTVASSGSSGSPATVSSTQVTANNPLVARLMQQMSSGQMVSVNNLLAQRSLQQGSQPRAATAFKIQGGNVVHQVTGGKPIQLTGKGQLVQIGGKGQQALGLIQTPQGTINIIPQTGGGGAGVVTLSQPKQTGATTVTSQGKVLTTGQVPAQFLLQQGTSSVKTTSQPGSPSILVTSNAGTQNQNLQMVRLSQQAGFKPGQATILISQQGLQAGGAVLPTGAQVIQQPRTQGKTTQQAKPPMYARIITPPSGMNVKLGGGVQGLAAGPRAVIQTVGPGGQTVAVQNEASVRQTLNKIITVSGSSGNPSTVLMTTVSSSSPIATSQQILAAAAAGKAAVQKLEVDQEKK